MSVAAIFEAQRVPYALMGGLAVAAWGAPRATEDVDFLAEAIPSAALDSALRAAAFDVADLLGRAGSLPELERRAAVRGVLDLLRQVRASTGL